MADFRKPTTAGMAADNPGADMGTSGSMREIDWGTEDAYWRENYATRPYVSVDRGYEYYQPAYRFGATSASRYAQGDWATVEPELAKDWDRDRADGGSKWDDVKDAVRDAWDRARQAIRR
jgi:hypothetical protein